MREELRERLAEWADALDGKEDAFVPLRSHRVAYLRDAVRLLSEGVEPTARHLSHCTAYHRTGTCPHREQRTIQRFNEH